MTIAELADYLKLSKSTLYKLAQEGKVPGQKVGKHWRFHKSAVDRWLGSPAGDPNDKVPRSRRGDSSSGMDSE